MKNGRGITQGCCLSPILFTLYSEYLTREGLEGFGDFKIGKLIRTVKYTDDLGLVPKEATVLQGMTDRLIEVGRCGMEINGDKSKLHSDIFPTRCNITHFIYFWKTALHVSGGTSTHHQEHTQLHLQRLVLVKPLLLPAAIVKELELLVVPTLPR